MCSFLHCLFHCATRCRSDANSFRLILIWDFRMLTSPTCPLSGCIYNVTQPESCVVCPNGRPVAPHSPHGHIRCDIFEQVSLSLSPPRTMLLCVRRGHHSMVMIEDEFIVQSIYIIYVCTIYVWKQLLPVACRTNSFWLTTKIIVDISVNTCVALQMSTQTICSNKSTSKLISVILSFCPFIVRRVSSIRCCVFVIVLAECLVLMHNDSIWHRTYIYLDCFVTKSTMNVEWEILIARAAFTTLTYWCEC